MLHVILCDDDEEILKQYRVLISQISERHRLETRVDCFSSGEALLFAMEDNPNGADILYLDVQMKALNGVDTAKQLRGIGCTAQIVFLTNSREYVFESFDASPLQYLLKGGFTPERFEEIFLRAVQLSRRREGELFNCERGAEQRAIPVREISYFEVAKRIVTVHYDGGRFDFYCSMDELETRLQGKGFVRTHRSFLVNVTHIRRIDQDTVGLTSGEEVPLSRTHVRPVREALSKYLSSGMPQ